MKRCNGCKQVKSYDEFYKQPTNGPNGYAYMCKPCYNDMIRTLRKSKRVIIEEAKGQPCVDCGIQYPSHVMQFDHIEDNKDFNIGSKGAGASVKRLQAEIVKCEIVCANCHAERTYQRANRLLTGVT